MTNELGHKIAKARELAWRAAARAAGHEDLDGTKYAGVTLGAYRRGKSMSWTPGALIDVWSACARGENATGSAWPHAYFIQTIGGPDGGHILCPSCRDELARSRVSRTSATPPLPPPSRPSAPANPELPF